MNRWALTMRYTNLKKQQPTRDLYQRRLKKLEDFGCEIDFVRYEDTAGLHLHGVISTPNGFNMKLLRCRGWRTVLKDMFDEDEWREYCNKDQPCDDDDDDDGACLRVIINLRGPLWKPSDKDLKDFEDYKISINDY